MGRYSEEPPLGGEACRQLQGVDARPAISGPRTSSGAWLGQYSHPSREPIHHLLLSQSRMCSWYRATSSLSSFLLLITCLFLFRRQEELRERCIYPNIHAISPEQRASMRLPGKLLEMPLGDNFTLEQIKDSTPTVLQAVLQAKFEKYIYPFSDGCCCLFRLQNTVQHRTTAASMRSPGEPWPV